LIKVNKMEKVVINSSSLVISSEGNGFYQKFVLNGGLWISFPGYSEITLVSGTPAQSVAQKFNGTNLSLHFLSSQDLVVCLLLPRVDASGIINLNSFTTYDENLPLALSSDRKSISLEGHLNFNILASDSYKLIKINEVIANNKNFSVVDDRVVMPYLLYSLIILLPFTLFSFLLSRETIS